MTRPTKLLWSCLLLLGCLGASLKVPRPAAVVQPPPNTNTYGCHLAWDAVPFADQYRVYLGDSPLNLQPVTNVTGPDAIFRISETNSAPWVGVKAVVAGQESDMSKLLTKTNWLAGSVEVGDTLTGPWRAVPGTAFLMETTNPATFARMQGGLSNNWPRLP